jgi:PH domain
MGAAIIFSFSSIPIFLHFKQDLEDKPDKWFNSPRGWLYKPSFTRSQQDRDATSDEPNRRISGPFSGLKAIIKGSVGSTYQKRYFILNMDRRFLAYYKDDQIGSPESGYVDMSRITDVQPSVMSDAPPFSFDLVSADKYYTLAAESQSTMIRWVYAINSCRPQQLTAPMPAADGECIPEGSSSKSVREKWSRYEYTYQTKGPLMLNVMGTTNKDSKTGQVINNWIIVTSFEPTADGKPGRSESTGVISVKDYLVAVNGTDLMRFNFNEAMDIINRSPFPKTIQFLRDNSGDRQVSRAEGWAVVFYPSLNRKRRRYVDVRWDSINFRKPAPGGSANAQRDAFVTLDKVESIKPMIDKTMPLDQQYILRLICKAGAVVDHVGDDDNSLGSSAVSYIDLCFAKDSQMKNWRSILVSPTIFSNAADATTIPVHDLEIIESNTANLTKEITNMAIKSDLTGHFAPRDFNLNSGFLHWTRVGQKMQTANRQRGMELCNSYGCMLKSVRAIELPAQHRHSNYKFQLILSTDAQTVTIGFKDEISMLRWLEALRDVVKNAPSKGDEIYISATTEKEYTPAADDDDDLQDLVGNMRSTNLDGNRNGIQGECTAHSAILKHTRPTLPHY